MKEGFFLLFEASVVLTTLTGEPTLSVFLLLVANLVYKRLLDDGLFFIFLGALCTTLVAKAWNWKPKRDNMFEAILEGAFVLLITCAFFPSVFSLGVYIVITQRWEPSAIILGLQLLNQYQYSGLLMIEDKESYLRVVVYYSLFFVCFHVSILIWRKLNTYLYNPSSHKESLSTHTVPPSAENTHCRNE
jgi:hypothetical protein